MNTAIEAVVGGMFVAVLLPGLAAQQKPAVTPLIPVTVCEILANPQQFNGRNLAVVGRFSTTDEGRWLAEDDCGRKLVTDGYTWPNLIWLHCCYEPAPDPQPGPLVLDEPGLTEKLKQVRKTTQLRIQKVWVGGGSTRDGKVESTWSGYRDVRENWAVAFGRVEARRELIVVTGGDGRLWGYGFGHLNAAPVQLVINQKDLREIPDETRTTPNGP